MKKSMFELWTLWKKSTGWDEKTSRQKMYSAWFSLSFIPVGMCCNAAWWFIAIAIVNFAAAAYSVVKYVPMTEED